MEANESVVEVAKFYDIKIAEILNGIKKTYETIAETEESEQRQLKIYQEMLRQLEERLQLFLDIRKSAIDQIYYVNVGHRHE